MMQNRSQWRARRSHEEDEEEVCCLDYVSSHEPSKPASRKNSKDMELSLEVEIADSLKHLIASPDRKHSQLLDVTIIRPADLDKVGGSERQSTFTLKSHEVRNLIATMEKEKERKMELIQQCQKNANPTHDDDFKAKEERKQRSKATENKRMSILTFEYGVGESVDEKTPMSILKPLVGEIKASLRTLEATISQAGDHINPKDRKKKEKEKFYFSDSTSADAIKSKSCIPTYSAGHLTTPQHTQQIYATADNFDKIRKLLVCQNSHKKDDDDKTPCMCQHCGMVGLLIDSQKRPVITAVPIKPHNDIIKDDSYRLPKKEKKEREIKLNDEHLWLLRDICSRLEALEIRMGAQENRAVPKEYFKRIMSKILYKQEWPQDQTSDNSHLKDRSTQYSLTNIDSARGRRDIKPVRHRNVQIQQNTKKSYYAHPVLVSHGEILPESLYAKESRKSSTPITPPTAKLSPLESFWRWGEEIIKPGFDLKSKILSLLDEQFQSLKMFGENNHRKKSPIKINLDSGFKTDAENSSSPYTTSNLSHLSGTLVVSQHDFFEHPMPFEPLMKSKDAKRKPKKEKCREKDIVEKEIKTRGEAAVQKEIYPNNIPLKCHNDTTLFCTRNDDMSSLQSNWNKDFPEMLDIPQRDRNIEKDNSKLEKLSKRSAIPVRVARPSTDDAKFRKLGKSLIPRRRTGKDEEGIKSPETLKPLRTRPRKLQQPDCFRGTTTVQVKYMNPKVDRWEEESGSGSMEPVIKDINSVASMDKPSVKCQAVTEEERRPMCHKHTVAEKMALISKLTNSKETGNPYLWNLLRKARHHCKSKNDCIIVQIPTKTPYKRDGFGNIEVELTIEDVQRIMSRARMSNSAEGVGKSEGDSDDANSFLLIHSKKVYNEVRKHLGKIDPSISPN